ncbi:thiolase domain-containing protein [Phytohabitans sp. ZYX-F-186]|uniref:Thiolase domain-containing protein n=1 Tax=Phytohabitans maris TaxID=3071409 RepID=A0ABU0ZFC3_9ACTN|nr:thiolase domain-containing protein [Phytohabitans sp. ZYX-F-186]MDQ7905759.1 thiolase domain-containing protein [Phytohabitans sp. ZYX-F-186]
MTTDVLITGWAHSRFGKLDEGIEALVVGVAAEAIAAAGLEPEAIDAIYYGQFNAGMHPLAFASSLALQADDGLWGKPATRVENACASGAAAVHSGLLALRAGAARNVLVVGAEKMTHAGADVVGASLLGADYDTAGRASSTGFAGLFAEVADEYARRYGDCADTLGTIAAKSHRNALDNPYAHLRKPLDEAFCRTESPANPRVAGILRRTDCSPISDGAAALVLGRERSAAARHPAVRFLGVGQANDYLPAGRRDPVAFAASRVAWDRAMAMAGTGTRDLSFLEVHDCFTIAELVLYETLGLAAPGKGAQLLADGVVYRDGALPVNPSGGLKSKGHPVGATGVSQHVLAAMQLTGTAGALQLDRADRAAVHNMGGLAVANYVSILEAA